MGNTELTVFDQIAITVLKNAPTGSEVNLSSANEVHWMSSGHWTIISVTNQIEAGTFISLLELFRNAGYKGKGITVGAKIPLTFQTVKTGAKGIISRVQPLENEDSFTAEAWE